LTPLEEFDFWTEVENRRNVFFYIWVGWLAAGFPLFFLFDFLFGEGNEGFAVTAALATWGAVWFRAGRRLAEISCLRCEKRAFPNPYFFMKDAKCANCGYRRTDNSYEQNSDK